MDFLGNIANLKVDTVLGAVDKYVPGAQNKIKNLADRAKAYVNNVSELELKVLEATNHDPWGPHGSVMQEITNNAFHSEGFYQILGIVDQRLQESPENWRLVYKALLLLEFMVKHGPMSVSEAVLSYSRLSHLEKLRDRFEFKEASGRDQGINVRQRAGALVTLVQDSNQLAEERDKAAKNKSKYTGVSSSSMRYGGFGPGGGSSGSSSSYSTSRDFESSYSSSSMGNCGHGGSSGMDGGSSGYWRSSSSASGAAPGPSTLDSTGGAAAAAGADPVEATRQRIARLKADGALPAAADIDSPVGPGFEGDSLSPKKPKKLSEIKINPAISATFAKGGLAPPPSSSAARGSDSTAAARQPAPTGIDLLGDLDDTPPGAPAAAAAASSSTAAAKDGGLDDWDGFASAVPAAAPASSAAAVSDADDWAAFDSAPPAGKQAAGLSASLSPLPAAAPAAATGSKGPLPLDDFCSLPVAPVAAAPRPTAAAPAAAAPVDLFAPMAGSSAQAWAPSSSSSVAAGAGSSAADPFAASGSVHMMSQAAKQHADKGPKLGPETAKAKDPFADLALI